MRLHSVSGYQTVLYKHSKGWGDSAYHGVQSFQVRPVYTVYIFNINTYSPLK